MCGIAGAFSPGRPPSRTDLEEAARVLRHRGPDGASVWADGPIGLAHARLRILDLSEAADQPMRHAATGNRIVFNGEIYNYRELRSQLEKEGEAFQTRSDTEVILAAYHRWGLDGFERLNGVFGFALWDLAARRLILVRDPLGVKPLFAMESGSSLYFGSEQKAVLALSGERPRLHRPALAEYLWFGAPLGTSSFFEGIQRVEPGAVRIYSEGVLASSGHLRRWQRLFASRAVVSGAGPSAPELEEAIASAVRRQMVSDVPVGIFLSGGLDSGTVARFASRATAQTRQNLTAYTVSFDAANPSADVIGARRTARRAGLSLSEVVVNVDDGMRVYPRLLHAHDEPFADAAGIPLFLLCEGIGRQTPVILQGDGGDEVFAGYRRYLHYRYPALRSIMAIGAGVVSRMFAGPLRGRAHRLAELLYEPNPALQYARWMTTDDSQRSASALLRADYAKGLGFEVAAREYERVAGAEPLSLADVLRVDQSLLLPNGFLEKVDRATMALGIEARVPLLDLDLLAIAKSLPESRLIAGGVRKFALRQVSAGYLPIGTIFGRKSGFGVPVGKWMRQKLSNRVIELTSAHPHVFDGGEIRRSVEEHQSGKADNGLRLWKVLQLAEWLEMFAVSA